MEIDTKQAPNGIFYCYATINGYDYSYEGKTEYLAQQQMRGKIASNLDESLIKWNDTVVHPKREKIDKSKIGYQ